jgi:hypothetical protein
MNHKAGDKVIIKDDTVSHTYKIGEEVEIIEPDQTANFGLGDYYATNKEKKFRYITDKDI